MKLNNYEIIYLVITGEANSICLNDYYYSLQEIAEIFEGRLKGKILHFSNAKVLDLDEEEAQYFLDITSLAQKVFLATVMNLMVSLAYILTRHSSTYLKKMKIC